MIEKELVNYIVNHLTLSGWFAASNVHPNLAQENPGDPHLIYELADRVLEDDISGDPDNAEVVDSFTVWLVSLSGDYGLLKQIEQAFWDEVHGDHGAFGASSWVQCVKISQAADDSLTSPAGFEDDWLVVQFNLELDYLRNEVTVV